MTYSFHSHRSDHMYVYVLGFLSALIAWVEVPLSGVITAEHIRRAAPGIDRRRRKQLLAIAVQWGALKPCADGWIFLHVKQTTKVLPKVFPEPAKVPPAPQETPFVPVPEPEPCPGVGVLTAVVKKEVGTNVDTVKKKPLPQTKRSAGRVVVPVGEDTDEEIAAMIARANLRALPAAEPDPTVSELPRPAPKRPQKVIKANIPRFGRTVTEASITEGLRRLGVDPTDLALHDEVFDICKGADQAFLGHAVWQTERRKKAGGLTHPVLYLKRVLINQLGAHGLRKAVA